MCVHLKSESSILDIYVLSQEQDVYLTPHYYLSTVHLLIGRNYELYDIDINVFQRER